MKIFTAAQIRNWDAYTIKHEPISSVNLMERAAAACYNWIMETFLSSSVQNTCFKIFCGKGNNGGDGIALARMLLKAGKKVTVYILEFGHKGTDDFQTNLERLHEITTDIHFIQSPEYFPVITDTDIVIDAIFGTGLNKPLEGFTAELAQYINRSPATVIAIDIPSGMFADKSCKDYITVHATHTLSFQQYKLCFLLPENEERTGSIHILNIGLHNQYYNDEPAVFILLQENLLKKIYRPRKQFSHKGTFGHAALITGSIGFMGASVLCAKACMRSGVGKLTCYIPKCGYEIIQITVPEAMSSISGSNEYLENFEPIAAHESIGIGPGIGMNKSGALLLEKVFTTFQKPVVVDADALNLLSTNPSLLAKLPHHSILTPHPKEFERLFGKTENDFERLHLALSKANQYNCFILLKGHYSFIACPDGKGYFNSTGNAGMATAGSGDVLTGILTGFLAQGYTALEASILGVYLHGLSGDIAAAKLSQEAMIAGDIINCLGDAFKTLQGN
ncbi:MAG: NAD(P)H-hydrate dehydratase [Sphingobacteriales bacterium]|nr:NAD(P)H-hydrate dehydratase [Sphingobacteriales bacterium]